MAWNEIAAIIALLQVTAAPLAPPAEPEPDEIVVRAVKGKCRVQLAERILTKDEFDERAEEWAKGKPVRVIEPVGANYKCLAKITFRLNDKGVRLIHFVDRPEKP